MLPTARALNTDVCSLSWSAITASPFALTRVTDAHIPPQTKTAITSTFQTIEAVLNSPGYLPLCAIGPNLLCLLRALVNAYGTGSDLVARLSSLLTQCAVRDAILAHRAAIVTALSLYCDASVAEHVRALFA